MANGFLAKFLQLKIPSFLFIFLILCKILLLPHNAFTLGITKNNANCLSLNVCLCSCKFLFYQMFYQVTHHPLMDEKMFYLRYTMQKINCQLLASLWDLNLDSTFFAKYLIASLIPKTTFSCQRWIMLAI